MTVAGLANVCSHLQNAYKARLGLTSIPSTKYNLQLALALHRAGLISSVTRAGPTPPTTEEIQTGTPEPVTTANVATRRLWLGLKYWNNRPVVSKVRAVSKPTRMVGLSGTELKRISNGLPAGGIKGVTLGECLFLSTDRGVLEAREALERKVGGVALCRVS
jgi:small subunit ribosomal protein S8